MKPRTNTNKAEFNFDYGRLTCAICVLYIVFSPAALFAKTLAQYRDNIHEARDLTLELLYPDEENAAQVNSPNYERAVLTKIRQRVPANEKIDWQGASIETNNQWLDEKLNELESVPSKRTAILTEIGERFDALDRKIEELETASAQNRAKDEDKQKLAEILRRDEYQKPVQEEESLFQKIYRKIINWLANFFPKPDLSESTSGFQSFSFILQMLLYALILGVIGFLIYKFAPSLIGKFRGGKIYEKKERIILGEKLSPDQSARDLFDEAERLAREGDLRLAIRKGYIALLCDLGDRKIIGLSRHKTNRDYLRDVRGKSDLYRNMNNLTVNFERHWYGFALVEEKDWEQFRNDYRQTIAENR